MTKTMLGFFAAGLGWGLGMAVARSCEKSMQDAGWLRR